MVKLQHADGKNEKHHSSKIFLVSSKPVKRRKKEGKKKQICSNNGFLAWSQKVEGYGSLTKIEIEDFLFSFFFFW